jgi:hypothetical protein
MNLFAATGVEMIGEEIVSQGKECAASSVACRVDTIGTLGGFDYRTGSDQSRQRH